MHEYTLHDTRIPNTIQGMFFNEGMLVGPSGNLGAVKTCHGAVMSSSQHLKKA